MKLETILPIVKVGALLLLGGTADTAATVAYNKNKEPVEVKCVCNCNHPPIKGELIFKK